MLRSKQISLALCAATNDGISASLLLDKDGTLLGTAGDGLKEIDGKLVAAILSNIYSEFRTTGNDWIDGGGLKLMLFDLDNGRVGVVGVGQDYMICVHANTSVKFGLIKAKLEALQRYFDDQLRGIDAS